MGRKSKYGYEEKKRIVEACLSGKMSIRAAGKQIGTNHSVIQKWIFKYQKMGEAGLITQPRNKAYPAEIKEAAVADYQTGKYSLREVCGRYEIRSESQLINWIRKYNGHEQLKTSGAGGKIVTKGRNTTFDERVDIVKACIESQHNYNETALRYGVSYQQVRSWTVKYEQSGVDALQDRRGKRKPESEMSELEKLRAQNKLLEARNRHQALEIEFLKKLKEMEGGVE